MSSSAASRKAEAASAAAAENSSPLDYCRIRTFSDTNGDQPVSALICDEEFPISYRERACLNACRAHWDYSKGYLTLYTENPNRQAKSTQENYIHGVVLDPGTFLENFGQSRIAKANRLEKEAKALVNLWNKSYGPQSKSSSSVCMPKATMFQLAKHSWPSRGGPSFSGGEEKAYMLLEITTYSFAEAAKEQRFQGSSGESFTPKITLEDLEVYIKIASTRIKKAKSDKSNSVASSNHTTVYESLGSSLKMNKELLKATAFDRWGFRMKLTAFLKMLVSPFMADVADDCISVLRCRGYGPEAAADPRSAGSAPQPKSQQQQQGAKRTRAKKPKAALPAKTPSKSVRASAEGEGAGPKKKAPPAAEPQARRPKPDLKRKKLNFDQGPRTPELSEPEELLSPRKAAIRPGGIAEKKLQRRRPVNSSRKRTEEADGEGSQADKKKNKKAGNAARKKAGKVPDGGLEESEGEEEEEEEEEAEEEEGDEEGDELSLASEDREERETASAGENEDEDEDDFEMSTDMITRSEQEQEAAEEDAAAREDIPYEDVSSDDAHEMAISDDEDKYDDDPVMDLDDEELVVVEEEDEPPARGKDSRPRATRAVSAKGAPGGAGMQKKNKTQQAKRAGRK